MIYQIEKLMIPPTPPTLPTLPTLQVARSGTPLRRAAQRKGLQSKGAGGAWSCRASKGGSVHHLKWGFSTYQKLGRTEKFLDDCVKYCETRPGKGLHNELERSIML